MKRKKKATDLSLNDPRADDERQIISQISRRAEISTLVDIPEQFYSYATHELFHYFHCGLATVRSANKHTIIIHGLVCSRAALRSLRFRISAIFAAIVGAALLFASIYQLIVNFAAYSADMDTKKAAKGHKFAARVRRVACGHCSDLFINRFGDAACYFDDSGTRSSWETHFNRIPR